MQETATVERAADPRLLAWLAEHHVEFEVHRHAETMTAAQTARAEHVDPHCFAKTVVLEAPDGRRAIATVEASDKVDLRKAARAMGVGDVHLVPESELVRLAPDDDPGAWPPVGELFTMSVLVDHALHDAAEITFSAGSHSYAVRVDRGSWEVAAGVGYADLAADQPDTPAWLR